MLLLSPSCPAQAHTQMYHASAWPRLADPLQVTTLGQRCQKLESEVQKLAQTWSEAAPAEEIKVSPPAHDLISRTLVFPLMQSQFDDYLWLESNIT